MWLNPALGIISHPGLLLNLALRVDYALSVVINQLFNSSYRLYSVRCTTQPLW